MVDQIFPPFRFSRKDHLHPRNPLGFYDSTAGQEESIDLQIAHGMAPEAALVTIFAAESSDPSIVVALRTLVANRLASLVSNSFGSPLYGPSGFFRQGRHTAYRGRKAQLAAYEEIFLQAACTGVGMYFSTGDNGARGNDPSGPTPSWPASSPWVTAVGGTGMALGEQGQYIREFPWGHQYCKHYADKGKKVCDFVNGGGGGVSTYTGTPFFQQRHDVAEQLAASGWGKHGGRVVPDVAALADPSTG